MMEQSSPWFRWTPKVFSVLILRAFLLCSYQKSFPSWYCVDFYCARTKSSHTSWVCLFPNCKTVFYLNKYCIQSCSKTFCVMNCAWTTIYAPPPFEYCLRLRPLFTQIALQESTCGCCWKVRYSCKLGPALINVVSVGWGDASYEAKAIFGPHRLVHSSIFYSTQIMLLTYSHLSSL